MFAVLGFCCVIWLLMSPSWRLLGLTRQDPMQMPLLEDGSRRQVNRWLVCWFGLSLLAFICWIWFFKSGKGYKEVSIAAHVPWLWPNEDFYLTWVIYLGLFSNSLWLIWLVILDYRTTLWCSCIVATCVSVLICIGRFAICGYVESVCWVHMLGWSAAALAFIGNIFRLVSVEQRDFSLCAFFVAVAGTAPEILWMFNVIFVESGTLFANDGKTIGFWDIFFKRNCHWKASWTLNSLLRFPELVLLIKQIDQAQLCQSLALTAGFCSSIEWPAWKNEALRWVRRERE